MGLGTTEDLAALTRAILQRLRDPQADFELQAYVQGESDTVWLSRRGPQVTLRALGPGGGEVDWHEAAFQRIDPQQAFWALAERINLVALYAGGPFPDDLMPLFRADESQPLATYKAEWPSWDTFLAWLRPAHRVE